MSVSKSTSSFKKKLSCKNQKLAQKVMKKNHAKNCEISKIYRHVIPQIPSWVKVLAYKKKLHSYSLGPKKIVF